MPEQQENYAFTSTAVVSRTKQTLPSENHGAIIDSGSSSHFCPDRTKFRNFVSIEPQEIHMADGSITSATGKGDVELNLPNGEGQTKVTLKNTLYVPKMTNTLISTNRMTAAGFSVIFKDKLCKILSPPPKRITIAMIPHVNGLYSVAGHSQHHANIVKGKLTVCELHRVLGHVSQTAVLDAVKKGLIEGVELDSTSQPEFCDACTQAKASRQPFPAETKNRARTYGELVHTDLWGPAQTTSISGYLYYISFTDDYSRETKVQFLKQKSEALTAFRHYEANLARQNPGPRLRKLRSDRGGEYLSAEFDQYLKDQGIERQLTVHHSPQQNGVAERLN
jgi:hypothetical protein